VRRVKDIRGNVKDEMNRFEEVCEFLRKMDSAVLAFSGGFDSSYLAEACVRSIEDVTAVFVDTPMVSRKQRVEAERIAGSIGIPFMVAELGWKDMPGVEANGADRCYRCKRAIYSTVRTLAVELGTGNCICGDNYDDLPQDRPGHKAAVELFFFRPLESLKVGRKEIVGHVTSKDWSKGLVKDTCLSTRIPCGTVITDAALREVEEWEALVRKTAGVEQVRFRYYGDSALVQTSPEELELLRRAWGRLKEMADEKGISLEFDLEGYKGF